MKNKLKLMCLEKLTLQMRITIIVGIILVIIAVSLTFSSIYNARGYFGGTKMNKTTVDNESNIISNIENSYISNMSVEIRASGAQKKFSTRSIWVMVVIIIVGILVTYWAVGKALYPLRSLCDSIENINENNLNERVKESITNDEVGMISSSFNTMMNRLENSFDTQRRFAYDAAHELKTPLATIKTSFQVLNLDDEPGAEDYKDFAETTNLSVERLIKMVDNLLNISNNSIEGFSENIELHEIIRSIVEENIFEINKKNIAISYGNCSERIRGNKALIYRAFFNLVENAIKYNRDNGFVEIVSNILDNGDCEVFIRDSGIGINEDDIKHIVEPFYRADKSRSQRISGNGLGMAIVKSVVEKHNGEIFISSTENVGTEVKVVFYNNPG